MSINRHELKMTTRAKMLPTLQGHQRTKMPPRGRALGQLSTAVAEPTPLHVHLNAALDSVGGWSGEISCPSDFRRVHEIRERSDAIAVGRQTFETDRPRLSVRADRLGREPTHQPMRIVLTGTSVIADHVSGGTPLIAVGAAAPLKADGWLPCAPRDIAAACTVIARAGVRTLLLEGGPTLWRAACFAGVVALLTVWVGVTDPSRALDLVRQNFPLVDTKQVSVARCGAGMLVQVAAGLNHVK